MVSCDYGFRLTSRLPCVNRRGLVGKFFWEIFSHAILVFQIFNNESVNFCANQTEKSTERENNSPIFLSHHSDYEIVYCEASWKPLKSTH